MYGYNPSSDYGKEVTQDDNDPDCNMLLSCFFLLAVFIQPFAPPTLYELSVYCLGARRCEHVVVSFVLALNRVHVAAMITLLVLHVVVIGQQTRSAQTVY